MAGPEGSQDEHVAEEALLGEPISDAALQTGANGEGDRTVLECM